MSDWIELGAWIIGATIAARWVWRHRRARLERERAEMPATWRGPQS